MTPSTQRRRPATIRSISKTFAVALAASGLCSAAWALEPGADGTAGATRLAQAEPLTPEQERELRRQQRQQEKEQRREERQERREQRQDTGQQPPGGQNDDRQRAREERRQRDEAERNRAQQEQRAREEEDRQRAREERRQRDEAERNRPQQEQRARDEEDRQRAGEERRQRDEAERNRPERRDPRFERREDREERRRAREERERLERELRQAREERRRTLKETLRREREAAREERRQDRLQERLRREEERLRWLRERRRERREDDGRRLVIEEPDRRIIIRRGDRYVIRHNDLDRLRRRASDFRVRRIGGEIYTEVRRPNGVVIITVTDRDGRIIRRIRRLPNGRNFVLFDNRPIYRGGRGPVYFEDYIVDLPPPRIRIPRNVYILEAEDASEEDIYDALTAGPVERLPRGYSLDEVRNSIRLRERMRSVDLNTINFDFGSWEIAPDQYDRLEVIAEVLKRIIRRNPDEVFLLEGHTDAVGSEVDNLTLSDRRAEAVARVLTEEFGVPGENLVTQGYGEQFLKINTQLPERANRRVTIRRIKPLLSQGQDNDLDDRRRGDDRTGGRYGRDDDIGEDDYGDDRAESERYYGRGYGIRR